MIDRYRKHLATPGDWHFHRECTHWPNQDYVEGILLSDPTGLCLECIRRYYEAKSKDAAALRVKSKSSKTLFGSAH